MSAGSNLEGTAVRVPRLALSSPLLKAVLRHLVVGELSEQVGECEVSTCHRGPPFVAVCQQLMAPSETVPDPMADHCYGILGPPGRN